MSPMLIPTAPEIDAMPSLQRARARKAVARIAVETTRALDEHVDAGHLAAAWGERVRADARLLQAAMDPDPDDVVAARRMAAVHAAYGSRT